MLSPLARLLLVLGLGINCTIGYGTLFYSFSLLALEIEQSLAWTSSFIYGVYSIGLLIGGCCAPYLGRCLDRYGTRYPMAFGSFVIACCLYGLSIMESKIAFVSYLLLLEIFSILVLYESAFVAIVKAETPIAPSKKQDKEHNSANSSQRRSITYITLMAGFASTIFWPLIAFLLSITEWRTVYECMALLHLLVCFPLHFYCLRFKNLLPSQGLTPFSQQCALPVGSSHPNNPLDTSLVNEPCDATSAPHSTASYHAAPPSCSTASAQKKREWLLALSLAGTAFCITGGQIHFFSITQLLSVDAVLAGCVGTIVGLF